MNIKVVVDVDVDIKNCQDLKSFFLELTLSHEVEKIKMVIKENQRVFF